MATSPMQVRLYNEWGSTAITLTVLDGGYAPAPGNGVEDVTETIQILLAGTSDSIRGQIEAINSVFARARVIEQYHMYNRLLLGVRFGDSESWWESEIKDGSVSVQPSALEGVLQAGYLIANLSIRRDGFWEQASTSISLYTPNGTGGGTTGVNIFNCDDRAGSSPNKQANWVHVRGSTLSIKPDLPSPMKIVFFNQENDTDGDKVIWIANNTIPDMANGSAEAAAAYFMLECESGTGGSDTDEAACSGGHYRAYSLGTSSETDLVYWTLNAGGTLFSYTEGRPYHVMARFHADSSDLTNIKFRLKILSGSTVIWQGPQVLPGDANLIQDLGVINLPPTQIRGTLSLILKLTGQRTTSNTETVNLDFIQFFAADNFVKLKGLNELEYDDILYYGGNRINAGVSRDSAAASYKDWIIYGPDTLMVYPDRSNLFMFLIQSGSAAKAEIDRKSSMIQWNLYHRRSLI